MVCIRIKYCGFTKAKDIRSAAVVGASAVGLIHVQRTIRFVTPRQSTKLLRSSPILVLAVGVYACQSIPVVCCAVRRSTAAVVQHHSHSAEHLSFNLGSQTRKQWLFVVVIRMPRVSLDFLTLLKVLLSNAHFKGIVLDSDTKISNRNTLPFDWTLIDGFGLTNLLVAGGVKISNIATLLRMGCTNQLDVASGIEVGGLCGSKSKTKMKNMVRAIAVNRWNALGKS